MFLRVKFERLCFVYAQMCIFGHNAVDVGSGSQQLEFKVSILLNYNSISCNALKSSHRLTGRKVLTTD